MDDLRQKRRMINALERLRLLQRDETALAHSQQLASLNIAKHDVANCQRAYTDIVHFMRTTADRETVIDPHLQVYRLMTIENAQSEVDRSCGVMTRAQLSCQQSLGELVRANLRLEIAKRAQEHVTEMAMQHRQSNDQIEMLDAQLRRGMPHYG